jgi:hypothetical protein
VKLEIRKIILFFLLNLLLLNAEAQFIVEGTVYDSSRLNYVEGVRVVSTAGVFTVTDTMGHYSIMVRDSDSLYFEYRNKPTQKFPVSKVEDPMAFDISIKTKVNSKYKVLKEVIVYSTTYKQDSIENRNEYGDVFNFRKPGLSTTSDVNGGVGFDLAEIINIFRFRRNKYLTKFRDRLQQEEEEKYVDMKFSPKNVSRITGLKGEELDSFLVWYRPSYEFVSTRNEVDFTQYILSASYHFKSLQFVSPAKKED